MRDKDGKEETGGLQMVRASHLSPPDRLHHTGQAWLLAVGPLCLQLICVNVF